MAKRIIECQVNDEYVVGSGVVVGAAGSHDDVVLRLTFNDMWVTLNKYATFRNANGESPTVVAILPSMLVDGEVNTYDVPIPAEAKKYKGKMMLTLTGYSLVDGVEEDRATNTATAYFRVLESDFALFDDGTITPTLAQQLLDEVNNIHDYTEQELEACRSEVSGCLAAESERVSAEKLRIDAENTRLTAEVERVEAETARLTAETSRAEAEAERVSAEANRAEVVGDIGAAVDAIVNMQENMLNGNAELIAKEEVIKAINETLLIANDLNTNDPYKALSAAQGVALKGMIPTNYVPNTRTVNGKPLNQDINLLASDLGASKIESGYYNGTGGNTLELTFSFVPKIVFIVGHYRSSSSGGGWAETKAYSFGYIAERCGFNSWKFNGSDVVYSLSVGVSVAWSGTTCTMQVYQTNYSPLGMEVFNAKSNMPKETDAATEEDGCGYWYYAFG